MLTSNIVAQWQRPVVGAHAVRDALPWVVRDAFGYIDKGHRARGALLRDRCRMGLP